MQMLILSGELYYMMQSVEHYVSGIRAQGLQEQLAGHLENII